MRQLVHIALSDATGVPYYRQVVVQIAERIRCGELKPKERLPSVRELARQLVVSLITTRRAYEALEEVGLIVRRHGQGTFVAEDVQSASRQESKRELAEQLKNAIDMAGRMGLSAPDIEQVWVRVFKNKEGKSGN